jgi:hypothetical protein
VELFTNPKREREVIKMEKITAKLEFTDDDVIEMLNDSPYEDTQLNERQKILEGCSLIMRYANEKDNFLLQAVQEYFSDYDFRG